MNGAYPQNGTGFRGVIGGFSGGRWQQPQP
jgi:hypothetical protein